MNMAETRAFIEERRAMLTRKCDKIKQLESITNDISNAREILERLQYLSFMTLFIVEIVVYLCLRGAKASTYLLVLKICNNI